MNTQPNMEVRKALPALIMVALAIAGRPLYAGTFSVDTTQDAPASADALTQGTCDDGLGHCTLRAAIEAANAASEASTINVPAGTYTLTVTGVDEASAGSGGAFSVQHAPDASKGDLNITQSMTIIGAGSGQTVIGWAPNAKADRVLHVEVPPAATADINVSIQGITVENGYVPSPATLDDSVPTAVIQFIREGGGIAIGPSSQIATVDTTVTHGEGEGGCGSGGGGHGGGGACAGPEGRGGAGESESGATIGLVTLTDVHVIDNQSGADGGGIYNTAPLILDHTVITGNTSGANGGGLYNEGAMTMTASTVGAVSSPNAAENGGGLFETGFHTSLIEQSAIVGNSATGGGGIAGRRMVLQNIVRSTISNNIAADKGGGITTNGRVTLNNVTVAANTVPSTTEGGGAGLNGFGPASGGAAGGIANAANFSLVNSIVANNTIAGTPPVVSNCGGTGEGDPAARFFSLGHNLEDADTCNLNGVGDKTGLDPLLQPLADNGGPTLTMALLQSSPAIDAGNNTTCYNNDQRGQLGRADGNLDGSLICDIGAYELFVPTADLHVDNISAPNNVYTGDVFDVTMQVHVEPTAAGPSIGAQIITEPLPANLKVSAATITTPSGTRDCQANAGSVVCDVGTLAPGDIATLDLTATATSADPSMTIAATVSQSSPADPDPNNNSAHVHISVVGESNLSITTTGRGAPVHKGADTAIGFSIANAGPESASNVRIGIFVPNNMSYKSVDLPGAACVYDDTTSPATLLCTIDTLPASGTLSGTLTLTAATAGQATATFAVDAYQKDINRSDNQSAAVLAVDEAPAGSSDHWYGCTVNPRGGFDPILVGVVVAGLIGVNASRRRHARRHHAG